MYIADYQYFKKLYSMYTENYLFLYTCGIYIIILRLVTFLIFINSVNYSPKPLHHLKIIYTFASQC